MPIKIPLKPIEIIDGEPILNLSATVAGDDWIRYGRLLEEAKGRGRKAQTAKRKMEKMDQTEMVYIVDDEIGEDI